MFPSKYNIYKYIYMKRLNENDISWMAIYFIFGFSNSFSLTTSNCVNLYLLFANFMKDFSY